MLSFVRAGARANPVLRSVLIVLAVLIALWLAWLTSSMRLGALASHTTLVVYGDVQRN